MDGQKQVEQLAAEEAEKAAPAKQPRHSFMDIRRPKPAAETPAADAAKAEQKVDEPKAAVQPEVTPAPPKDATELADDPAQKLEEPKKEKQQKEAKPAKPPKTPRQPGVGLAIFATVVIVLGLAALATYAYLRTNNVAPF